jgi:hypothetical protein
VEHKQRGPKESEEVWIKQLREEKRALLQSTEEEARRLAGTGVRVVPRPGNSQLRGMIGQHRGRMAEERVVRLLNESPDRPSWLLDARQATPEVDQLGVDVVVVTRDLGPLPLQVKSSAGGAEGFRRRRPNVSTVVGVVVAPIEMADANVWTAVMVELTRLRDAANPAQDAQAGE